MITWKYGNKLYVILLAILDIFVGLQNVFLAFVTSNLFAAATAKSMSMFTKTAIWALFGFIVISLFNYVHVSLKNKLIKVTNINIKNIVSNDIIYNGSPSSSGEVISSISNDLKLLETNGINNELLIIEQTLTVIFSIIGGFYFNILTTMIFVVGSLVPTVISKVFQSSIRSQAEKWSVANGSYTSKLNDIFSGLSTIRLYFAQGIAVTKLKKKAENLEDSLNKMNNLTGHIGVLTTLAALIIGVLLPFGFGIYQIIQNALTLAAFMGIVQLSNSITNPLMTIIAEVNSIQTTKGIQDRIPNKDPKDKQLTLQPKEFHDLSLEDVSIVRDNEVIIPQFSLNVSNGQKILIKGPSGCGKSTILHTILGEKLYAGGKYLVNNHSITEEEGMQLCSLMNQKPYMFNESLLFNITLGGNYSQSEIDDCIKRVHLDDLVKDKGLDYIIDEHGNNLSGGQAQRIEIARALITHRPVILADEVTSALDDALSDEIHQLLLSIPCTLIEVAHHIPVETESEYDKVVVLK